jgi:hypothetical protein
MTEPADGARVAGAADTTGVRRDPRADVRGDQAPTSRARRTVATFRTYREAERAVDFLSDRGFPVQRVAIIGSDLRLVEQVTGRMTYGQAALRGAASGALVGVLVGWLFGLFNWVDPLIASLTLAVYGLIFGAIVGALLGLLLYAMTGGRRDFASVSGMQANRYDLMVDEEVADEAAGLLAEQPAI